MNKFLNISEATSIALHLCVWLAMSADRFVPVKRLAAELGFSPNHMAKVAQQLVRAGILNSVRGPSGGLRLARTVDSLSMLDLYQATMTNTDTRPCLLKGAVCRGNRCALGRLIAAENSRLMEVFARTTLADVVKSLADGG